MGWIDFKTYSTYFTKTLWSIIEITNYQVINQNRFYCFLFSCTVMLSSCVTHSELLNFTQGDEFPNSPEAIDELPTLKIQADDQLYIRVLSLDLEAVTPYNVDPLNMNTSNLGSTSSRPLLGYLVDYEGYIDFPVLGRIKVGGFTTGEVRQILINKLKPDLLKDPTVIVRILNFRITVLGEVESPGTFQVSTERITLFDALGLAGDLQPYANRTNILVTREQNGSRIYGRLNLQDRNIFHSPFYFLQQNDFIYVEPLQERTAALRDQSQRILPYISAGVTLVTLIITLTSRK